MQNLKAFLAIGAIVLAAGCSRQSGGSPDDAIGLGEPAPAATTPAEPAPASTTASPTAVAAGNGEIARVVETCNLEQVNGQAFGSTPSQASKAQPVAVNGWVVDKEAGPAAIEAELRLINSATEATYAVPLVPAARDDVATSFGLDPATAKPGFSATFDAAALPAGDYKLYLVVRSDKGAASCDNGRAITIAD